MIARISSVNHHPAARLDDNSSEILVVNFRFAAPHNHFSRAIIAHIEAIAAAFEERHGHRRRVYFKIDRIVVARIARINDLELAAVEALNAEGRGADRKRKLRSAGIELRDLEIGFAVEPNDVASGELNFSASVAAGEKLIAFIKREVDRRV